MLALFGWFASPARDASRIRHVYPAVWRRTGPQSIRARGRSPGVLSPRSHCFRTLCSVLCLLISSLQSPAQISELDEYRARATFLARFPSLVQWPDDTFPNAGSPFLLCVFGDFRFGTKLAETVRGITLQGRAIEVHWVRKEKELRACQILYVSRSEASHYGRVLEALGSSSILTFGETPEFLNAGGAVFVYPDENMIRFDVNLAAVQKARLKFSSRLLALAHRVVHKPDAKSS